MTREIELREHPTAQLRGIVDNGIGWIVYNQPERHNAMSRAMLAAIPELCSVLDADDEVRVVVLRGAGERAFVSGADLNELSSGGAGSARPPSARLMYDGAGASALLAISKPLVAMIHGYCLGGGLLTALCADIRIASDDAQFSIPAARLGVGYPYEGVEAIVRLVGPAMASEILLSAERFDAATALRTGLVNRVVAKAGLEDATRALAASIAAGAPMSQRAAKQAIRLVTNAPGALSRQGCDEAIDACWQSEDFGEGRRAFAEKRAPRFSGR